VSSLDVEGLIVRYGQFTAVHGIDLHVDDGEVVVVLGANGAGKSSTLNALSGAVKPAAGTVTFDGAPIAGKPSHRVARRGLVQVPEGRHVIGPLSVQENLLLGAYGTRSKARRSEILASVFEMFPVLETRRDGPAGLLSGGEQQMLAFGRALMADPRMLLLDEPSMGLAPVMIDRVMEAVRAIAARGISILMVEQNATAAFAVASRAYVLEQGEVVLEGPAEKVADDPRVLQAFLGLDETAADGTLRATGDDADPALRSADVER
jgi:branched-chain amino acid transport system ATP-binding protein